MIIKAKYSLKKKSRSEELSKDLKSLLKGLLEPDPAKRLTMTQVRKHPWLQVRPLKVIEIFTDEEL
jgi:serine/threonine protein kinase